MGHHAAFMHPNAILLIQMGQDTVMLQLIEWSKIEEWDGQQIIYPVRGLFPECSGTRI